MKYANEIFAENLLEKEVKYCSAESLGYEGTVTCKDNIKAIFYDAEEYKGIKTKVFAYIGTPDNPENKKLPAILLIHGGGGTAFECWVKQWIDRGYVAMAMDLTGNYPVIPFSHQVGGQKEKHAYSGPTNDEYATVTPKEEVWLYHAITDVIYAHNILRSLPYVDNDRIGIYGISYGGVVTSAVVGVDNRFLYAVSVYGCGYMYECRTHMSERLTPEKKAWDSSNFLKDCDTPVFWMSGDCDSNFDISAISKSALSTKGEHLMSFKPAWGHSHGVPWNEAPEIFEYVDSKVKGTTPLISFGDIEYADNTAKVKANIPEGRTLDFVRLVSNSSDKFEFYKKSDAFEEVSGSFDGEYYIFSVPENSLRFYIYGRDRMGNITSSTVFELNK